MKRRKNKNYKVPQIHLLADIDRTMVLCRLEDYELMRDYFYLFHEPNSTVEEILKKYEKKDNKDITTLS